MGAGNVGIILVTIAIGAGCVLSCVKLCKAFGFNYSGFEKIVGDNPKFHPGQGHDGSGFDGHFPNIAFRVGRRLDGVLQLRAGGFQVMESRAGPCERNSLADGGSVQHDQRVLAPVAGEGGHEQVGVRTGAPDARHAFADAARVSAENT